MLANSIAPTLSDVRHPREACRNSTGCVVSKHNEWVNPN